MGILFERKENKNTNNSRKNREELQQYNDKVCILFYSFASHLFATCAAGAAAFAVVVAFFFKCIYREAFGTINANWNRHRDIKYESPECIESDPTHNRQSERCNPNGSGQSKTELSSL